MRSPWGGIGWSLPFMRGVRWLRPVRPTAVPSWDLSVVLEGLVTAPFEPLESAPERILTLKVNLLLALTSLKRVGDLQALSVSEMCMDFARGLVKVTLRPRPGYIPEHPHRFALRWSHFTLSILLPLLRVRMRSFTCSARYGHWSCMWIAPRFGENPPSCWCVLVLAAAGLPHRNRGFLTGWETPFRWLMRRGTFLHLSLRAHSTRGVASSQALFRGVPLEDLCVAAGWSSPHTFVRFYNLAFNTAPGSQILSVWTGRMLIGSLLDQVGSVFSLVCLVYRSQSVNAHTA